MKIRLLIILFMLGYGNIIFAGGSLSDIDPATDIEDSKTRTMSIHKTGFFSKKVTTIVYNVDDYSIVSVEVNGKMLPEKDFKKYEKMVLESRELRAFSALEPEYDEVLKFLDEEKVSNTEKLAAVDNLLMKLKKEKVSDSSIMISHLDILKSTFNAEILREKIFEVMQESDATWVDEIMTAEFKKGLCTVNKKKLSKELSARLYKLLEEHKEIEIGKDESVVYYF